MGADLRFIHCSDLHLDTPFKNISRSDPGLAERMTDSSFRALDTIIDRGIREDADFIIFSGDIFDHEYSTPRSRHLFAEALRRFPGPCFIAYGNHDHRRRWEESIPLPPNAVVFPEHPVAVPFPNEEDKVAEIIGVSHGARHEDRDLTEDIQGSQVFTVAAVHCDLDTVSEGRRYAPAKLTSLLRKKVDYWALGHIHRRNIVHKFPHVVYPGNTQGRSPKETGEKGAYLVTVSDGVVRSMEFFRTGPVLWTEVEQDISGKDMDSLLDGIAEGTERGSILKLTIRGRGDLDRIIRLQRESFRDMVERRTGCIVASMDVASGPSVDLDERRGTGDFVSAVISSGDAFLDMERGELIDRICGTRASASVRYIFEDMEDSELRNMVRDARMSLIERLTEERP